MKLNHRGGLDTVIGWIQNARLGAGKLIGDLELCKSSPSYNFVRELVSKFSTSFGLSPAFTGAAEPMRDGSTAARCRELHSIDLVESPASNPTGLFSARYNDRMIEFSARPTVVTLTTKQRAELAALRRRIGTLQLRFDAIPKRRRFVDADDDDEPRASVPAHAATGALEGAAGIYGVEPLLDKYLHGKPWKNPFRDTLKGHGKKLLIGAAVGAAATAPLGALVEHIRKGRMAAQRESKMSPEVAAALDDFAKRKRQQQVTRFARLTPEEQRQRALYRVSAAKHRISEDELNRAASNYTKAGATGALAGALIGSLRSKAKIGAGIGALAGIGSIKAIRSASPADPFGQHSPEEKAAEKAVPITAGILAAIAARKKLKQITSRAAENIGRNLARSGKLFD